MAVTRDHKNENWKEASQARSSNQECWELLGPLIVDSKVQTEADDRAGPEEWMETEDEVSCYTPHHNTSLEEFGQTLNHPV